MADRENFASTSASLCDYKTAEVRSNCCWSERQTLLPPTAPLYSGAGRGPESFVINVNLFLEKELCEGTLQKKKSLTFCTNVS